MSAVGAPGWPSSSPQADLTAPALPRTSQHAQRVTASCAASARSLRTDAVTCADGGPAPARAHAATEADGPVPVRCFRENQTGVRRPYRRRPEPRCPHRRHLICLHPVSTGRVGGVCDRECVDAQVTEVRVHHAWHQSALGRQTPQGRAQLGMLVGHQPGPQRAPGGSASGPTRRRPYANSRPASAKRGDAMAPMPRRGRTVCGRCVASAAPPMSSYGRGRGLNNLSASAHEGQARPMEAPGMRVIVVGATDVH